MPHSWMPDAHYPIQVQQHVIFNDPQTSETACWTGAYANVSTVGITGDRLTQHAFQHFDVLEPIATYTPEALAQVLDLPLVAIGEVDVSLTSMLMITDPW